MWKISWTSVNNSRNLYDWTFNRHHDHFLTSYCNDVHYDFFSSFGSSLTLIFLTFKVKKYPFSYNWKELVFSLQKSTLIISFSLSNQESKHFFFVSGLRPRYGMKIFTLMVNLLQHALLKKNRNQRQTNFVAKQKIRC